MANFKAHKVVSSLPGTLEPDALYVVRVGVGFDLYVTDDSGLLVFKANADGGFHIGETAPDPAAKTFWLNTETGAFLIWTGSAWMEPGVNFVPPGGAEGQALVKASSADFDGEWATLGISDIDGLSSALSGLQPAGSYLTTETDPVFVASVAYTISSGDVANWNAAHSWGNHASAGYASASTLSAHIGAGGAAHSNATGSVAGFMSASDKTKLDGIATGATANAGTVTSVQAATPTGLEVSGGPITGAGTLTFSYASGYAIPTTAKQSEWDTAYGWGNHASAGYLLPAAIGVTVQAYNANTVIDASYVHTDNNYTTAEKNKLAGIAAGAEVNVNADWNAVSGDAQILNKPSLGSAAAADTGDFAPSTHVGSGAAAHALATTEAHGFMSSSDKVKLNSVASGATANAGTVTSVQLAVPTGLEVSGGPVTDAGTFTISFATGYAIPTTSKQGEWDTAFGWGNHSSAGYLTSAAIGVSVQAYAANLTSWAAISPSAKADASHTHTASQISDSTTAGRALLTAADAAAQRTALSVESTTQLNSRDTANRNRANHTGTQAAATISDFNAAVRAQVVAALVEGTNITLTLGGSGDTQTITVAASGGGGGGDVSSVNGQTGDVVLDASDVGALSADLAQDVDIEVTSMPTNARLLLIDVDGGNVAKYITGANLRPATAAGAWAERRLIATQTLTNNTTMQDWFTSAGGLPLDANSTYEFEGTFVSLNGTTSHGLNMQFAAIADGTIQWNAHGVKAIATTQATAHRGVATNTFDTARNVTTASTVAGNMVRVWGTVRTGAGGGTLRPQVAQTAASGSFTVQPGTYFKARRVGANTLVNTGEWV